METVKVDTQKLHLLNERIAQTIDALHQLRQSAQVLGTQQPQSAQVGPWSGGTSFGYGTYGQQVGPQFGQQPWGITPWGPMSTYGVPFGSFGSFGSGGSGVPHGTPFHPQMFGGQPFGWSSPFSFGGGTGTPINNGNGNGAGNGNGNGTSFDGSWSPRSQQPFSFGNPFTPYY